MDPSTRAKLAVRRSPALWSSYVTLRFPTQRYKATLDALCLPHHDLLLDGYPRAANSYAYNFLTHFHEELDCVHHSHASATLKMARRLEVPGFVLIREPLDALTSNVIRSGDHLPYYVGHYEQYYGYVRENLENVDLVPFDTVTQDPVAFLGFVEEQLGLPRTDPDPDEVQEANRAVEAHLENLAEAKYGEEATDKKAVPDADRERRKARVAAELEGREDVRALQDLYQEVLAAADARDAALPLADGAHM